MFLSYWVDLISRILVKVGHYYLIVTYFYPRSRLQHHYLHDSNYVPQMKFGSHIVFVPFLLIIIIEHNFVTYNVNAQNLFSQFYYYFFFTSVFFLFTPYDLISNNIMEPSLSRLIWHKGEKNYVWFAFLSSTKNVDNWVLRVYTFRMEAWQVY